MVCFYITPTDNNNDESTGYVEQLNLLPKVVSSGSNDKDFAESEMEFK
jgi:hypothetical protein